MLTLAKFKSEIKNDISRINKIINSTLLSTKEPKLVEIYTHINKQQGKQIRASLMILIEEKESFLLFLEIMHLTF